MRRIRFVHWNRAEAEERASRIRALGYDVDATDVPIPFRRFAEGFDALVIDLSRLPSEGRDVGVAVRIAKPTRAIPLVFVSGVPEKVARVRETLPDATFTSWEHIGAVLERAKPVPDATVPASALAGYSKTPLPKKVGVKDAAVVALVGAPDGFEEYLGSGVVVRRGNREQARFDGRLRSRRERGADLGQSRTQLVRRRRVAHVGEEVFA